MDTTTQAQLYLAEQRGQTQTNFFRSYHTFNFGQYWNEHRAAFGALTVLNDDTLYPGFSRHLEVVQQTHVVLIPLVGGLEFKTSFGTGFLEAGQAQHLSLAAGTSYTVSNPYEAELINFLHIWLSTGSVPVTQQCTKATFDLSKSNQLHPAFGPPKPDTYPASRGYIGRFTGRQAGTYRLAHPGDGVFVFVLSGVFEVQNRLLHERDGLALTSIDQGIVDFEALSGSGILLVIEVPV